MTDQDCVDFLRWALPPLRMRWAGFRKVRRQVCKRLQRRLDALNLTALADYRDYLARVPGEWSRLESLCRITISRLYRDRQVFDRLCDPVLQTLAAGVRARGEQVLALWSAGCGRGEEPYTLALAAHFAQPPLSALRLEIVATDIDAALLASAQSARYRWSSLKDLPATWLETAFTIVQNDYCLREPYRQAVRWIKQDIRRDMPDGRFELILCRNLVFTYFDDALQRELLERLIEQLQPAGALVIGKHESLPEHTWALSEWFPGLGIYRKQ